MNASPPPDNEQNHQGRADFWRGFFYGTGNTLALTVIAFIVFLVLRR